MSATAATVALAQHASADAAKPVARGVIDTVSVGARSLSLSGWAYLPGSAAQLQIVAKLDGHQIAVATAKGNRPDVAKRFHVSPRHGYGVSAAKTVTAGRHTLCIQTSGRNLACRTLTVTAPSTPRAFTAKPVAPTTTGGTWSATLAWTAPTSAGTDPISGYVVTTTPATKQLTTAATATGVTLTGLTAATKYLVRVVARSAAGTSGAALTTVTTTATVPTAPVTTSPAPVTTTPVPVTTTPTPTPIAAQVTPAPVATSYYLRHLTGAASDVTAMRALGVHDAPYNPTGHSYLALLDIGGQDESRGGVVLSATSKFLGYSALVTDIKAYLDGYSSTQLAGAPMVIAVGTNNDMDVSTSAGRSWMVNVVAPLRAYASKFSQLSVVGADDMEPGFSASVGATRNWLSGYLAAGTAPFYFNGSADGCPTGATAKACNNGWAQTDLAWLSGGAAPSRIGVLPQIYNNAMAQQWARISLYQRTASGKALVFGGPLTEWSACSQSGSCGSLTGVNAWSQLWAALNALPSVAQKTMPYATDLMIN